MHPHTILWTPFFFGSEERSSRITNMSMKLVFVWPQNTSSLWNSHFWLCLGSKRMFKYGFLFARHSFSLHAGTADCFTKTGFWAHRDSNMMMSDGCRLKGQRPHTHPIKLFSLLLYTQTFFLFCFFFKSLDVDFNVDVIFKVFHNSLVSCGI